MINVMDRSTAEIDISVMLFILRLFRENNIETSAGGEELRGECALYLTATIVSPEGRDIHIDRTIAKIIGRLLKRPTLWHTAPRSAVISAVELLLFVIYIFICFIVVGSDDDDIDFVPDSSTANAACTVWIRVNNLIANATTNFLKHSFCILISLFITTVECSLSVSSSLHLHTIHTWNAHGIRFNRFKNASNQNK